MHEAAMAEQIVRTVTAAAASSGATGVRSVDVEVGALDGVSEEGLRAAFALAANGTILAGSGLRMTVAGERGLVIRRASLVLPEKA